MASLLLSRAPPPWPAPPFRCPDIPAEQPRRCPSNRGRWKAGTAQSGPGSRSGRAPGERAARSGAPDTGLGSSPLSMPMQCGAAVSPRDPGRRGGELGVGTVLPSRGRDSAAPLPPQSLSEPARPRWAMRGPLAWSGLRARAWGTPFRSSESDESVDERRWEKATQCASVAIGGRAPSQRRRESKRWQRNRQ